MTDIQAKNYYDYYRIVKKIYQTNGKKNMLTYVVAFTKKVVNKFDNNYLEASDGLYQPILPV